MKVIEFFEKHNIKFYWIYYYIQGGKKKFVSQATDDYQYPDGYRSSQNFIKDPDLIDRQQSYYRRFHNTCISEIASINDWKVGIMCDTHKVRQFDIDDADIMEEFKPLLTKLPYYYSVSKKLPHIFFTTSFLFQGQASTSYEDGMFDVLHGTCGLVDPESIVHNAENTLCFNYENFIVNYVLTCKSSSNNNFNISSSIKNCSTISISSEIELLIDLMDEHRADDYNSWIAIGLVLKKWNDRDIGLSLFDKFSKKCPNKYDFIAVQKKWDELKPDGRKGLGSLHYYARKDNPNRYRTLFGRTYSRIKQQFEISRAKIITPACYIDRKSNDEIIIRTETEMKQAYMHMSYYVMKRNVNEGHENDEIDEETGITLRPKSFINTWMKDPHIRIYEQTIFSPNLKNVPCNNYNLFNGFDYYRFIEHHSYNYEKGLKGLCILQNHIRSLSGKDRTEDVYHYIVQWLAQLVQYPEHKIGIALLFRSRQGAGKTLLFDYIGKCLLGAKYYFETADANDIFGDFNSQLDNKLLIVYDEAAGKDTFTNADNLKNKITGSTRNSHAKFAKKQTIDDYARYVFLSNNLTPVRKEDGDRRFMCIRCSDDNCGDDAYFEKINGIVDWRNKNKNPCRDTLYAFYNWLSSIDVSKFSPINDRPRTNFDSQMVTIDPFIHFLYDRYVQYNGKPVEFNNIFHDYSEWITDFMRERKIENYNTLVKRVRQEYSTFLTFSKDPHTRRTTLCYHVQDLLTRFPVLETF